MQIYKRPNHLIAKLLLRMAGKEGFHHYIFAVQFAGDGESVLTCLQPMRSGIVPQLSHIS